MGHRVAETAGSGAGARRNVRALVEVLVGRRLDRLELLPRTYILVVVQKWVVEEVVDG